MALRGLWTPHFLSKLMATKQTKLDAVNIILSNIGQAPVVKLDSGNPMVETAELVLEEISRTVQAEGWVFNTEFDYPFVPNTSNEIDIADNILSADLPVLSRYFSQIRGGKLYNRTEHTYEWTTEQKLDVVWLFDFDDLPEAFKNYVTIRAANVFAGRSVGSQEAVRFGQTEELQARAGALEYETQQGDYNIFGNTQGLNTYSSYRPSNTVFRF
uniref:Tail tubular protein A n=1 Tax=uncultured marine virus TaxID=186617 RepID=A0A0F7L8A0_9VIRU|nr:hypothetical protein S18_1049_0001 [uncultured marine virus]